MFKTQRKKRRGGILGFKELAAKAGLSPWHFHRVFRSVTGLTPKAYGDACWDTVTSSISPSTLMAQNFNKPAASTSSALSSTSKKSLRAKFRIAKREAAKDSSDENKSEDENDITPSPKTSKTASPAPTQQKQLRSTPELTIESKPRLTKIPPSEASISNKGPNDSPSSLDIYEEEQNDQEDNKSFFSSLMDDNNGPPFSSQLIVTDDVLSQTMYSTQSADSNLTTSTEDSLMDSWPMPNFLDSEMFPMPDAWVDSSSIDTDFMDDAFMQDMTASQNHQLLNIESARPRSRLQKVKTGLSDSLFENDSLMGGIPDPWNTNSPLPLNDLIDTVAPLHT